MNHNYFAEYQNIQLSPLCRETIELLRDWRNNPALNSFLRPIGFLTKEMQEAWFAAYLHDPNQIMFEITETSRLHRVVGSLALYDFKGDTAEIGKIVVGDSEAHGMKVGYWGMLLAAWIGFQRLDIHKYRLDVHEGNLPARTIYQQLGFNTIGTHPFAKGGVELEMELIRTDLETNFSQLKEISLYQGKRDLSL